MADNNEASRRLMRNHGSNEPLGANTEVARKLKQYYSALVVDEVPERFAQLLSKLEAVESRRDKG